MSDPSSTELECLVCASRTRIHPAMERRMRDLLGRGIDWTLLVELALAHGTTPLLYRSCSRIGLPVIPEEILEALRVHTDDNLQQNRYLARELFDLLRSFEDAGVSAIAFGAPILACFAYGDLALRRADPLALFVRAADFRKASDRLGRHGYCRVAEDASGGPPENHGASASARRRAEGRWLRERDGVGLRLCAGVGAEALAPSAAAGLWQRAGHVPLLDERIPAFVPEDWLPIQCSAASEMGWSELVSICDVAALLEASRDFDADRSLERARAWGCARAVLVGLELARRILGARIPPTAERVLEADEEALGTALELEARLTLGRLPPPVASGTSGPLAAPGSALGDDRAAVRAGWSARSDAWTRLADERGEWEDWLDARLVEAAGVRPDQTVLDLASGAGDPAIGVAHRLGGRGLVVATDLLPGMLAAAARRASEAGVSALRCCLADMETLPFRDRSFDSVLCRFGIMFCSRLEVALAEELRVLKSGARAAHLIWGPIEKNTMFRVLQESVVEFFGEAPRAKLAPFRLAVRGSLAEPMRSAGFEDVSERELRFVRVEAAGGRFWDTELERTFGRRVVRLPPKLRELLDQRIGEGFAVCRTAEGHRLSSEVRLVVGTRP